MVKIFISRDVNQNISQKKKITYELSFLLFPSGLSSRSFPLDAPVFLLLQNFSYNLASQAGVFRGSPYFVPPHFLGRDERRAHLKTPAWEQPRPHGPSLKIWVGRPTHFLREKPWGRGWRGRLPTTGLKKVFQNKLHSSADQNIFI